MPIKIFIKIADKSVKQFMRPSNFNFWLIVAGVVIIISLAFVRFLKWNASNPNIGMVRVNGHEITVELAETAYQKSIGLSGRDSLDEDKGMLFIFPNNSRNAFWMKDMDFNLDIIWIKDNSVVAMEKNVPYKNSDGKQNLRLYTPQENANYVLELNAGSSDKLGIEVGTNVEITL